MSSIRQQEPMKPAPKSPIPRSRSDFNYVGLTPKEKRWTTDFSLLLPPFPRDNTGYSRLAESPVTHQPKPVRNPLDDKSPTEHRNQESTSSSGKTSETVLSNSPALDQTKQVAACDGIEPRAMGRSRTLEPINFNETKRTKAMRRSPTLQPYEPKCNSNFTKKLYPTIELSPISGSLAITRIRNPLTNPVHSNQSTSDNGRCLKTLDFNRPSPQASSYPNANQSTIEANRLQNSKHLPSENRRCLMTSPPASEANNPHLATSHSLNFNQSPTPATHSCLKASPSTPNTKRPSPEGSLKLNPYQSPTPESTSSFKTTLSEYNRSPSETIRNLNSYQPSAEANNNKTTPFTSESNRPSLEASRSPNFKPSPTPEARRASMETNRIYHPHHLPPPEARHHPSTSRPSPEPNRHLNPTPEGGRYHLVAVPRHLTPEAGRHLMSIRKSPTMDSRTLR